MVHIEPSLDALSWDKREARYAKKFAAGRRHIPGLFQGIAIPKHIEQIALVAYGGKGNRNQLAGGRVMFLKEFMAQVHTCARRDRTSTDGKRGRSRGVSSSADLAVRRSVLEWPNVARYAVWSACMEKALVLAFGLGCVVIAVSPRRIVRRGTGKPDPNQYALRAAVLAIGLALLLGYSLPSLQ